MRESLDIRIYRRIKKFVTGRLKAYEPRLTEADVVTPGWPVDSGQDLEGNVKAVRYTLWAYVCIAKIVRSVAGLPMNFYQGYGDKAKKLESGDIPDLPARLQSS